jgi:hypothetical protein
MSGSTREREAAVIGLIGLQAFHSVAFLSTLLVFQLHGYGLGLRLHPAGMLENSPTFQGWGATLDRP